MKQTYETPGTEVIMIDALVPLCGSNRSTTTETYGVYGTQYGDGDFD